MRLSRPTLRVGRRETEEEGDVSNGPLRTVLLGPPPDTGAAAVHCAAVAPRVNL